MNSYWRHRGYGLWIALASNAIFLFVLLLISTFYIGNGVFGAVIMAMSSFTINSFSVLLFSTYLIVQIAGVELIIKLIKWETNLWLTVFLYSIISYGIYYPMVNLPIILICGLSIPTVSLFVVKRVKIYILNMQDD